MFIAFNDAYCTCIMMFHSFDGVSSYLMYILWLMMCRFLDRGIMQVISYELHGLYSRSFDSCRNSS